MNLIVFQENRTFVLDSFREGKFDYVDITTEIAETRFFKFLLDKRLIAHLAKTYPTPRKREQIPVWAAVVSNISLRYHGTQSFHSFPYIVRMGGLIDALSPKIAERKMDPLRRTIQIRCAGFNNKNHYPRKTPWDQDFVRKFSKDTDSEKMVQWYNKEIIWCLKETTGFDKEGLFIGDATYIFVPDNEKYEGSVVLLFDEHNHPVNSEKVNPEKLKKGKYQWRRCYQLVLIIHTNRRKDFFIPVALGIIGGKDNPLHPLYDLVESFVAEVGKGVMKKLILDRGFIDGESISKCKKEFGVEVVTGVKKSMIIYDDALRLSQEPEIEWLEYKPRKEPKLPTHPLPLAVQKREEKRRKTLEKKKKEKQEKEKSKEPVLVKTLVAGIQDFQLWQSCSVPIHVVLNKEVYSDGHEKIWMLATTERFEDPRDVRENYGLRPAIEERHRQLKLYWDLAKFPAQVFSLVVNQVVSTLLTYSLLQMRVFAQFRGELNEMTLPMLRRNLEPRADRVVLYYKQYFTFLTIHEHQELLLTLKEKARIKVLKKTRQLKRSMVDIDFSPRPP